MIKGCSTKFQIFFHLIRRVIEGKFRLRGEEGTRGRKEGRRSPGQFLNANIRRCRKGAREWKGRGGMQIESCYDRLLLFRPTPPADVHYPPLSLSLSLSEYTRDVWIPCEVQADRWKAWRRKGTWSREGERRRVNWTRGFLFFRDEIRVLATPCPLSRGGNVDSSGFVLIDMVVGSPPLFLSSRSTLFNRNLDFSKGWMLGEKMLLRNEGDSRMEG